MFRQIILLASFIALATSSSWFQVGTRVPGDRNISNRTDQTAETALPSNHTLLMTYTFVGFENTFTYSRFDVYEGHNSATVVVHEQGNGFTLSVSNYNTRHLTLMSTIYGIPNGQDPVPKITSKSLKIH